MGIVAVIEWIDITIKGLRYLISILGRPNLQKCLELLLIFYDQSISIMCRGAEIEAYLVL